MKIRILTLALVLMSTWSWSQTNGGELSGRTVSGTRKAVGVDSTAPNRAALRVKDSTLIATVAKESTLSAINSKIRDTLGGQILVHDSLTDYWFSAIQPDINGSYGELIGIGVYINDSLPIHHQQIEDSLHRLFEELQSIEQQIIVIKNTNHSQIKDSLSAIIQKIPSGLTVNSNRLAIYSPDSIRVFATNGFGGASGGTSLDAVDSTNLAGINTKLGGTLTVGSHAVTNAGTFAVQVDGNALTSLQLADDVVYTDGSGTVTKGTAILGQDGTNPQAIKTDATGELQVDVLTMPTVTVNTHAVTQSGTWQVQGTAAHDAALSGNPVNIGAKGITAEPTAITADRQVQLVADVVGKLITSPYANTDLFVSGSTSAITDTTSTSVIAAAGSGVRNYITSILVTNSHATVSTFVKILDGTTTLWQGYALAAGGGFSVSFPVPLRGTANTAINAKCVTTGSNVIVNCAGFKGR